MPFIQNSFQELQHGAIHPSRQPPSQENLQPALSWQRQPGPKTARQLVTIEAGLMNITTKTSILARKSRHIDGFKQEATEIELHLHNINQENGVSLCCLWRALSIP